MFVDIKELSLECGTTYNHAMNIFTGPKFSRQTRVPSAENQYHFLQQRRTSSSSGILRKVQFTRTSSSSVASEASFFVPHPAAMSSSRGYSSGGRPSRNRRGQRKDNHSSRNQRPAERVSLSVEMKDRKITSEAFTDERVPHALSTQKSRYCACKHLLSDHDNEFCKPDGTCLEKLMKCRVCHVTCRKCKTCEAKQKGRKDQHGPLSTKADSPPETTDGNSGSRPKPGSSRVTRTIRTSGRGSLSNNSSRRSSS